MPVHLGRYVCALIQFQVGLLFVVFLWYGNTHIQWKVARYSHSENNGDDVSNLHTAISDNDDVGGLSVSRSHNFGNVGNNSTTSGLKPDFTFIGGASIQNVSDLNVKKSLSRNRTLPDFPLGVASLQNVSNQDIWIDWRRKLPIVRTRDQLANGYLRDYEEWCQSHLLPKSDRETSGLSVCPCVSPKLLGYRPPNKTEPPDWVLEAVSRDVISGEWRPPSCLARQRVLIVIPFKDRASHLKILMAHLHPMLQRQLLHYKVVVIEQVSPSIFNKAAMMNIAFLETRKQFHFDCVVFQDVDMLAQDDRNIYTCRDSPSHVGAWVDKFNYKLNYEYMYGGVTAMQKTHFETLNGYSNSFYGWGGEDDDMNSRIVAQNWTVYRHPDPVARYSMLRHQRDRGNPVNKNKGLGFKIRPHVYSEDGLNSLRYAVKKVTMTRMYKHIKAALYSSKRSAVGQPPHPRYKYEHNSYREEKGDCIGKDLVHFMFSPLETCKLWCDYHKVCTGFVHSKEDEVCWLKRGSCDRLVVSNSTVKMMMYRKVLAPPVVNERIKRAGLLYNSDHVIKDGGH